MFDILSNVLLKDNNISNIVTKGDVLNLKRIFFITPFFIAVVKNWLLQIACSKEFYMQFPWFCIGIFFFILYVSLKLLINSTEWAKIERKQRNAMLFNFLSKYE